jgi:hypothetical protein
MISPWIWSQRWRFSNDIPSAEDVTNELIKTVNHRGYTPRNIFGLRLALEEALVKRIKERDISEAPTDIEFLCRATTTDLELLVDGEIVFTGSIENPIE